jgi:hypothetical protein
VDVHICVVMATSVAAGGRLRLCSKWVVHGGVDYAPARAQFVLHALLCVRARLFILCVCASLRTVSFVCARMHSLQFKTGSSECMADKHARVCVCERE